MKKIIIKSLELTNFKGIKNLLIDFGNTTIIRGNNGTGKTTIVDGFLWLLFGKNSAGVKDFAIKPLLASGDEVHAVDSCVAGVFSIDGKDIELRRVYREKYSRKRGDMSETFTGHETEYFINGVPVQMGEYKQAIADIIDEEIFKLLSSPSYFPSLPWQKRRETLLAMCGDLSPENIIDHEKNLEPLRDILKNYGVDDRKKMIINKKSKINDRLKEIPARIDELKKQISGYENEEIEDAISENIKAIDDDIAIEQANSVKFKDDGEQKRLAKIYREDKERELNIANGEIKAQINVLSSHISNLEHAATTMQKENLAKIDMGNRTHDLQAQKLELVKASIDELIEKTKQLKVKRQELLDSKSQPHDVCDKCGQKIADFDYDAFIAKENERIAKELLHISNDGDRLAEKLQKAIADRDSLAIAIEETIADFSNDLHSEQEIQDIIARKLAKESELAKLKSTPLIKHDFENDMTYQKFFRNSNSNVADTAFLERIEDLKAKKQALHTELANIQTVKKLKAACEQLNQELTVCKKEFAELSDELFLLEKFIVAKTELLESTISGMFRLAKFKMFETQINGGINECCTILYGGVPYGLGLNRGAEVNVGLDIINTLSNHYGFSTPVFIDNAEAIVKLADVDTQVIRLIVDGAAEKLEIAHE